MRNHSSHKARTCKLYMIDLKEQQASEEEDHDNDENVTLQREAGRPLTFKDLHPTSSLVDEAVAIFQNSDPL